MNNYIKYFRVFLFLLVFISCKKLVSIDIPKTQLTPVQAFADDQSAIAVISNIYSQFSSIIDGSITPLLSLYTDELFTTGTASTNLEYNNGMVSATNAGNLNIWRSLYSVIYQCNSLLENMEASSNITTSTRQQLKGEAYFLRSLSFFYLVNIYGDVPIILTTNVNITSVSSRDSFSDVYVQLIDDLIKAKKMLSESYPTTERVRANKWSAVALLARAYLYQKKWQMAESEATEVISSGIYNLTNEINSVFQKNSSESIFQFWTKQGFTAEGSLFIPAEGSLPTYQILKNLLNSFESGDRRRINWIDSVKSGPGIYYYVYKYKNRSQVINVNEEYLSILRISEQYLIRAEARAEQNNFNEALNDLNVVRDRAGLLNETTNSKIILLAAIEHEREVELFCESANRFFDLKRNGHLNQLMSSLKPNWEMESSILPIPQYELLNNPNLKQNPGY